MAAGSRSSEAQGASKGAVKKPTQQKIFLSKARTGAVLQKPVEQKGYRLHTSYFLVQDILVPLEKYQIQEVLFMSCQKCLHTKELQTLAPCWTDLYESLPALCSYQHLCQALGFKSAKSLSTVFSADPEAPKPQRVGRQAMFARLDAVLWAARRAMNAGRRGRKPAAAHV